ncbi:MAG: hypothetical protein ISS35_06160 [Kiritimatiellae bacterium]|nr:hypothetical protein [Kiritimatiellia bacterium]
MEAFSIIEKAIYALAGLIVGLLAGRYAPLGLTSKSPRGGKGRKPGKVVRRGEGVEMYVGNLAYSVSRRDLERAFGDSGQVVDVRIIRNKMNGKSKGYGFVEMADQKSAKAAVRSLNGKEIKGRAVVVKEARSSARD